MLDHIAILSKIDEGPCYPDLVWPEFGEVLRTDDFSILVFHMLVYNFAPHVWQLVLVIVPLQSILEVFELFANHLRLFSDLLAAQKFAVETFEVLELFNDLLLTDGLIINSFSKSVDPYHGLLLPIVESPKNKWTFARDS